MNVHKGLRAGAVLAALLGVVGANAAESAKKDEASRAEMERKLEAAQKRLDEAAREVADLSMSLSDHLVPHVRAMRAVRMQRAVLGVNIGASDEKSQDEGVKIANVSPEGAAEKAGLKADDVLLEVNGKALKREGDDSPREKLLAAMRDVKPGDKVSVRYRRDGKVNAATVVAEAPADRLFTHAFPHGEPGEPFPHVFFRRAGVFGSAELVPLTPKLGQYFGAEQGLLVVRAPEDARLKLEEGDVILDIDGRTPKNASHALRILGSYQPGEKLKLNVLRAKKRMTFDVTVPEDPWEKPFGGLKAPHVIHQEMLPAAAPAILHLPAPPAPPAPAVRVFIGGGDEPV